MSTLTTSFSRPQAGEYNPYYDRYISLVGSDDIVKLLEQQAPQTAAHFKTADAKADYRYAPGKWSVKEVLGHVNDTERIMAYRALRIARGDQTPLAGFEQDDYVRGGNFAERTLANLAQEFGLVRAATIALFRSLQKDAWQRRGVANKNEVSVRALAFIVAGHALHHRLILEERYFPAIPRA